MFRRDIFYQTFAEENASMRQADMTPSRLYLLACLLWSIGLGLAFSRSCSAQSSYTFSPIVFPGAHETTPQSINDNGQIVGAYRLTPGGRQHGFLLNHGSYNTIDFPGSAETILYGINNKGDIVGRYYASFPDFHGFILSSGVFSSIDFPGAIDTVTTGINNAGVIVGTFGNDTSNPCSTVIFKVFQCGFTLDAGVFSAFAFPGANTEPSGINDLGEIVGIYNESHGFSLNGGIFTSIDVPGAFSTLVHGVGPTGQIIGEYVPGSTLCDCPGFILQSGTFSNFNHPGGVNTVPNGMNTAGQIVGWYNAGFTLPGFLAVPGAPQQCTTGTTIPNVGLPQVIDPNVLGKKPYQIVYESLGLNFTETAPPETAAGILCSAQSNTGSLNVDLQFGNGPSHTFAHSTTSATVAMFSGAAVDENLEPCDFKFVGGISNNCILNSPFDPTATFVNWLSPGFTTEVLGSEPQLLQTGPLSFWVNINVLGLSQNDPFDNTIRVVEPFIHRTLISNLPMISLYTLVLDPGTVSLAFTDSHGLTTGVLDDGTISTQIPLSHYFPDSTNPAVLIVGDLTGTNVIRVTGVSDGSYAISAVSRTHVFPAGIATDASGFLVQGQSLAYAFNIPNDPTKTPILIIDDIPPVTIASLAPSPNSAGWNNSNVAISLNSTDNLNGSGVKQITYSTAGAQTGGPFTISGGSATILVSAEGLTTITYFAIDNAGNAESTHTLQVRIDKTPPVVTCNAFPTVLWPPNHKLVTVNTSVNVTDSLSGVNGFRLLSVTNSELDSGQGDIVGWTVGSPSVVGELRATRLGYGSGRIYRLTYRGFDVADNSATCSVIVSVPHDQGQ